jgi:hypothetical protein
MRPRLEYKSFPTTWILGGQAKPVQTKDADFEVPSDAVPLSRLLMPHHLAGLSTPELLAYAEATIKGIDTRPPIRIATFEV